MIKKKHIVNFIMNWINCIILFSGRCNGDSDFLCNSAMCIYSGFQCDGENDCGDMSDENHCSNFGNL